jgi:hypothetical protein
MADSDREIAELKEAIKGYETEYKTASSADKSELRGLIKSSRDNLTELLKFKKAESEAQGKISCNYQQYLMEFYDLSSWLYN